jgi:SOS-response transcriptional repressor LexA
VKFFFREEKRIRLVPANPAMPPRTYGSRHTITVQGKVVQVVRCGG